MNLTRSLAALSIASVVIAACAGATDPAASTTGSAIQPSTSAPAAAVPTLVPTASAAPSKAVSLVVYDGRVDVGNGRGLEVRCVGHGSPTILLEGGGISPSLDEYPRAWVNDLGKKTTVCHYSRAGAGTSSPLPAPLTMAGFVGDAYDLLEALETQAGVPGPYVFVGWSFGGAVALAEALAHPDRTAGLVILDTDFITDFLTDCAAAGRTKADCQAEYDGDIEAKSMEHELVGTIKPLPDIPIKIVNAMVLGDCVDGPGSSPSANISGTDLKAKDCASLAELIADTGFRGWSTLGPQVTQTRVQATHDGLIEEAGSEVAAVILAALAEARASKP